MRVPRLYTSQALVSGSTIELDATASHYLTRVLRMQTGRELILFNGTGGEFAATLQALGKSNAIVAIGEHFQIDRVSPVAIELAIGISRGERMDWVLQKATELGVYRITPLFSERTEVKLKGERLERKLQHWRQIVISACEQCQLNILPILSEPANLNTYLSQPGDNSLKLVLHHRADQSLDDMNKTLQQPPSSVVLLVGPEGGLSEEEIAWALGNHFHPLKLGPRILRTETAPVVALSAVQQLWGDLNDIA